MCWSRACTGSRPRRRWAKRRSTATWCRRGSTDTGSDKPSMPINIYVDADACPVKAEIYRVAERHLGRDAALTVHVVSNSPIAVPREQYIARVVVGAGMDAADHWIAERAKRGDVVITADVPLASRVVKAGA